MNKKPEKKYFTVKIETMVPATISYQILADDAEHAAKIAEKNNPIHIEYQIKKRKNSKLTVYDLGTFLMRYIRNF
jgi:uncharacterized membrane protein